MTTTVTVLIEGDKQVTVAVEEDELIHEPVTIAPGTFVKKSIFGVQSLIVTEAAE